MPAGSGPPPEALPVRAALGGDQAWQLERVFGLGRRERLAAACDLFPETVTNAGFAALAPSLRGVRALFTTWGMDEDLARKVRDLPDLEIVLHAAGTVQAFARPLLEAGKIVVSAWAANAVPVAHFALSQVLLSLKGYFRNARETRLPENRGRAVPAEAPGVMAETVSLLGFGMVGRQVAALLAPFGLDIAVYDPFLTGDAAAAAGVRKVSLERAFAEGYVVSNHLADLPPTRGLLGRGLFAAMRPGATFMNTGRGATVVESDLAAVLAARPDLTALLDVTFPEPPAADSPWYALPNVHLSSHIAGSNGREVVRLADCVLEEFDAWRAGRTLRYQVTAAMLDTMA